MAKIKFPILFTGGLSKKYSLPPGILPVQFDTKYLKKVVEFFATLITWIDTHGRIPEMDMEITIHYRDKTTKQTNTAWALYTIMANEQNGGSVGAASQMVQPMDLYRQNLRDWVSIVSPESLMIPKENLHFHKKNYRVIDIRDARVSGRDIWIDIDSPEGVAYLREIKTGTMITIYGYRGMSNMDRRQLAKHIDGIFNQLAEMDIAVTSPEEIGHYWGEHEGWKQDKKITEDPTPCTKQEYRDRHPICEATGDYIGDKEIPSELAHIKASGMGATKKHETMVDPTNTLHLKYEVHREFQHLKGWGLFKSKFPHLKNKINSALRG